MSKKCENQMSVVELLQDALVSEAEQPYNVPDNWTWTRLQTILRELKNGTTSKQNKEGLGERVTRIESVQKNAIDQERLGYIAEEGKLKDSDFYEAGDIVLSHINSIEHVGKTALINEELLPLVHGMNLLRLRLYKEKISPIYAQYYMRSYTFRNDIWNRVNRAVNQVSLNQKNLNQVMFPVAPLNEQKRIADKVESLLDKINRAKQLIDEVKETFELRRSAILDKAFRGELTANWREINKEIDRPIDRYEMIKEERLKIIENNRERTDITQMFNDFNIEESVDEKNWLYLKSNMFCYNINCGGTPSKDITVKGDVPFLKVYNIVNNKIAFEYKAQYIPKSIHDTKLKKSKLKSKDVIMNIVGPPLKKIAIIPEEYDEMNMNQAIVRFRPIKYVLPEYLYYCLQYDETLKDVINETRGVVGQSNISVSQSRNLVMPIPPLPEQWEIVKKIEFLLEKEDKVNDLMTVTVQLDSLKQSILSKAYRGELGTNDPTEESAIELLKVLLQEKVK